MVKTWMRFWRKVFVTLVGVCFLSVSTVSAATASDLYDQPTSLTVAEASNHKFVFTTASTADEGETIVFTFASQFDTSTITEDDVDVADDGLDLTTAADCSGTEKASVAMAADILTITLCAGDGGAMALGSSVTVEIGANATASGSGTNRITNPSAVATYRVTLGGTFGDNGSVPLAFVTEDSGSVSGSVAASGGGGAAASPPSSPSPEPEPEPEPEEDVIEEPEEPVVEEEIVVAPVEEVAGEEEIPADDDETATTTDDGGADETAGPGEAAGGESGDSEADGGTGDGSADDGDDETDDGGSGAESDSAIEAVIVTDGGLTLTPDGATFEAIGNTEATTTVAVEGDEAVAEVRIIVGETVYILSPDGANYSTSLTIPSSDATLTVEVQYEDGLIVEEDYYLNVRGGGLVYETRGNERVPVPGAVVTVYEVRGGSRLAWDASLYGSSNPLVLGDAATFSWYVPNGTYIVTAAKSGYVDGVSSQVTVRDHILAVSIELTLAATIEPEEQSTIAEVMAAGPAAIATATVTAVQKAVEAMRAMPEVQVAADIAAPATVVLAAASVVVLASSFSLLPFLQYLITSPILFLARRKRKAFGTVYNAATKIPVDLAIVRLFTMPGHKLVRSVVTDQHGKYLLTTAPGTYAIEVMKPNFVFPSMMLAGKKDDGSYLDVYTGQELVVDDKEASIAANIPLDPAGVTELATPRHIAVKRFLRSLQQVLAAVGVLLAVGVLIIAPSIIGAIMVGAQIIIYLLVRRLAKARKPKGWGIVYDGGTRQPVGNTVVRLFEPTYNKLIETVLTDRFGRYAFLVGPSEYYVSYSKPGYAEKIVRPIDYREKHEPSALALDVPIEETRGETKEGL